MQKYIVEIFDKSFEKVTDLGPFSYDEAHKTVENLNGKGFYLTITDVEYI
jgi:hypothetical protein